MSFWSKLMRGSTVERVDSTEQRVELATLFKVIEKGGSAVAEVEAMLNDDPKLVFRTRADGYTALHRAVFSEKFVKLLLAFHADVHAETRSGQTPLHLSAGRYDWPEDCRVTQMLLRANADINAKDNDGRTALYLAAYEGHKNQVQVLLANGADVSVKSNNGETAQHAVASDRGGGCQDAAKLLLANNADVNARDKKGRTPLNVAMSCEKPAMVDLLRQSGGQHASYTIHEAARIGELERVRTLLKGEPNLVFRKDESGWTPLHSATIGRHKEVAALLLGNNAEVDAKDNDGWTPLHLAAYDGSNELVALLLVNKANPNAKNNDGATPMYRAEIGGHNGVAELLRQHGGQK